VVMLGQVGPARVDLDRLATRWSSPDYRPLVASLAEMDFPTAGSLLATYAGCASGLAPWLQGAQINRDRNMRLQYLAGLSWDSGLEASIYDHMLGYRRYPPDFFVRSQP